MKDLRFITVWKPCPGFESDFEVSNLGEVKSIDRYVPGRNGLVKGRILKQFKNHKGYPYVRLNKNKRTTEQSVHRLVAIAFIPNLNNLPQVNHIDGNKLNNHVDNLEWVSNSTNQIHAYKLGLQPSRAGENNGRAKLTDSKVTEIKLLYNKGLTSSLIANLLNVKVSMIRQIISGRIWKSNEIEIIKRDDRKNKSISL